MRNDEATIFSLIPKVGSATKTIVLSSTFQKSLIANPEINWKRKCSFTDYYVTAKQ